VSAAVSVLMPVWNAEATLPAAIQSILRQTEPAWELVAVDDGSTDGTASILAAAARGDCRVRVVTTPHRGLVAALTLVLAHARAPLVARMDADDESHPERLALQRRHLVARPDLGLVAARVAFGGNARVSAGFARYVAWSNTLVTHEEIAGARFVESPIVHPSVMFRRELAERLGGYIEGDFPEDYELWLRLLAAGGRVARLAGERVRVRDHGKRTIRSDPRYRPAAFRALKLKHLRREVLRAGEPVLVWGGGRVAKGWARELAAGGVAVAALVDVHPRRVGRLVDGVPVVRPEQAARGARFGSLVGLGAVGRPGARDSIRAQLLGLGRREGNDFWFLA
jgi:glycosyltransferase involved in cell wall biosynthesis